MIRPACHDDVKALAQVKSRYVRALYRGFMSAEYLRRLDEEYFLEQVKGWLDGQYRLTVLEQDGEVVGYVAYGEDPEDANYGLIREVSVIPSACLQEKEMLMDSCLADLAQRYEFAHVMTLRDNFHVRFMFEQYGFRADGTQFTREIDGNELQIIRLVGRTSGKKA